MTEPIRPTEVQLWSRCPQLWQFRMEGWERPLARWTPERLLGTAIHAGMACWARRPMDGPDEPREPEMVAEETLLEGWPEGITDPDPAAFQEHARRCVTAGVAWAEQSLRGASILSVERSLGDDGHTTPDLVTREHGRLVVTDYKTSFHLPIDRLSYRLDGIERDHQFRHYVWALSEDLGEPVLLVRKVVIAATPKIFVRDRVVELTPESQVAWLQQAREKWILMNQGPIHRREEGCLPFGDKHPCDYYEACWTCHGDREQITKFYVRGEKT